MKPLLLTLLLTILGFVNVNAQLTANSVSSRSVAIKTSFTGKTTAMHLKSHTCYNIELISSKNGYFKIASISNMDDNYDVKMHGSSTGYWINCYDLVCYVEPGFGRRPLYTSPNVSRNIIAYANEDSILTPLAVSGNWVKVRCGGNVGWIQMDYIGASA